MKFNYKNITAQVPFVEEIRDLCMIISHCLNSVWIYHKNHDKC